MLFIASLVYVSVSLLKVCYLCAALNTHTALSVGVWAHTHRLLLLAPRTCTCLPGALEMNFVMDSSSSDVGRHRPKPIPFSWLLARLNSPDSSLPPTTT